MKKVLWNKVKRIMAGVMVAALLFTEGQGVGNEPEISVYGEAVVEEIVRL